ncbi:MAG TPA: hypothetical protein VM689_06890 [Aliidongia sp.]|nr:hypothetical protein [Aliidongia sp.]
MGIGGGDHFNPDEPRDERGRWTSSGLTSTKPIRPAAWRARPLLDGSAAGRAQALLHHTLLSLPDRLRRRFPLDDQSAPARLGKLLGRWADASGLDDETFRARFLQGGVTLAAVRALRSAARAATRAQNAGDMAEAGTHLASAVQEVGPDRWPRLLVSAEANAAAQPAIDEAKPNPALALDPSNFAAPALLERAAPSFLAEITPETLGWLSGFARAALIGLRLTPVALLGLIFVPDQKSVIETGRLPGRRDITYRLDSDTGTLDLTIGDGQGGPPTVLHTRIGLDGVFRDSRNRPVARGLTDSVLIDPDAVAAAAQPQEEPPSGAKPMAVVRTDEDEPKLCPDPGPDQGGRKTELSNAYENYISSIVNPENPLVRTIRNPLSVRMFNPVEQKMVNFDDCQHRTGILVEAKGPAFAKLMQDIEKFPGLGVVKKFHTQVTNQINASAGRPIVWFFAEKEAADKTRKLFREWGYSEKVTVVYKPMPGVKEWRSKP